MSTAATATAASPTAAAVDMTMVYVAMVVAALLMAALPFGVFLGLGSALGLQGVGAPLFGAHLLAVLLVGYAAAFGTLTLVQSQSCKGRRRNWAQLAMNAGIATACMLLFVALAALPPARHLVTKLLPPDLDPKLTVALAAGYWGAWGALFGVAVGGTLSGSCGAQ
jgi:hypothetical protein